MPRICGTILGKLMWRAELRVEWRYAQKDLANSKIHDRIGEGNDLHKTFMFASHGEAICSVKYAGPPLPSGEIEVPNEPETPRFHTDRVAGRDRHHRRADWPAVARRSGGARGRRAD